jgi:hypothetical protein
MSYCQAVHILDAVRRGEGRHYTREMIDEALRLTGDLE